MITIKFPCGEKATLDIEGFPSFEYAKELTFEEGEKHRKNCDCILEYEQSKNIENETNR